MLIQFNFKNYKSFRDEAILDLSASNISEHTERVVKIGDKKILRTVAIFGANAGGKSNIFDAFKFMRLYVLNSFQYGGSDFNNESSDMIKPIPFAFDKGSRDLPSEFEVYYVDKINNKYKMFNYGFSIKNNIVIEEWLNSKAKTANEYKRVFHRINNKIEFFKKNDIGSKNIELALENETLIVSLGAKLKIDYLRNVRNWFANCTLINFGEPAENLFRSVALPIGFVENESVQKNVLEYFTSFDNSIVDFNIKENRNNENGGLVYQVETIHKMIDTEETSSIHLEQESHGTLKMFQFYPTLQKALTLGSILFVDELNARLHPLLVRNIILTFLDPLKNINNAQLVFTTHDAWQLSNDLLRRDEIYFTEKNNLGISELYSLDDIKNNDGSKIRKDESYIKNYMYGKYGAVPELNNISFFNEDE